MKQNKGEAAFESVDEVLAEKIVKNSRDHGRKTQARETDSSPTGREDTSAGKTLQSSAAKWIIAAAIAAIFVIIGGICFGKYKKFCGKRFFR
jgi:hypothetical protein